MNQVVLPTAELLQARGEEQIALHMQAAQAARSRFGNAVFVRAVVEISNFCREDCLYCGMRRSNRQLNRYRARAEQIADLLLQHRPESVTDVNIQAGEDPVAVRELALPLIRTLQQQTDLGISVCLGLLDYTLYAELKDAGATLYIMKFETSNPQHYTELRAPGTLEKRITHIRHLAAAGWNLSSGFIAGLPEQTDEELIRNFALAAELPLDGISVSPFIPGDETPLSKAAVGDIDVTLNCMAGLRLMRPDWVIPSISALNLADPENGYRRGLRTGANLVTINMTPSEMRGDYLLYKRDRFIMTEERILTAIAAEGLVASTQSLSAFYRTKKANGKHHEIQPGHIDMSPESSRDSKVF
jgi:biotin synthase